MTESRAADPADELVAVVDAAGRFERIESRSVVRRDNLRHQATGVLVRNSAGQIYVHRRTDTKDVFPGAHDCMAGGVVLAGEDVREAAERELAEELGIDGVELEPLWRGEYADDVTRYVAHVYAVTWDGPIRHQAEEVQSGQWMSRDELREHLADPDWPFVPDSRQLLRKISW